MGNMCTFNKILYRQKSLLKIIRYNLVKLSGICMDLQARETIGDKVGILISHGDERIILVSGYN